MQKANAMTPSPPMELPPDLFSVDVSKASVPERNVFQQYRPPAPKPVEAPKPDAVVENPSTLSALANFKLTGIYMGEVPEALVETIDEQKTYALKAGSELRKVQVKEVKAEGVVFTDGKTEQLLK